MARTKKEQMQLMIFGAVVAGAALFAAVNFLLVPMIDEWKQDSAQVEEMQRKLESARTVVRSRTDILMQMDDERERLRRVIGSIPMPMLGNYLLDMDAHIRACAADTGLGIKTVLDFDVVPLNYAETVLQMYRVRVTAEGGVNDLVDFFNKLEDSNPLIAVSSLSITAQPDSPDRHDIRFAAGWLVWSQPEQLPDFINQNEPPEE